MKHLEVSQKSGKHYNARIGIPSLGSESPFPMCEGMSSSNQIGSNNTKQFHEVSNELQRFAVFHCQSESYLAILNFFN